MSGKEVKKWVFSSRLVSSFSNEFLGSHEFEGTELAARNYLGERVAATWSPYVMWSFAPATRHDDVGNEKGE